MSNQKVQLTQSQMDLLNMGTVVNDGNDVLYYSIPFWFKSTEENSIFERLTNEELPKSVTELLTTVTKLLITVRGGCVEDIISTTPAVCNVIDWDLVKQFDEEISEEFLEPVKIISEEDMQKKINSFRVDQILDDKI